MLILCIRKSAARRKQLLTQALQTRFFQRIEFNRAVEHGGAVLEVSLLGHAVGPACEAASDWPSTASIWSGVQT